MRISDWSSDVCSSDLSGRTHNASRGTLKDSRITGGRGGGTPSGSLHVGCPGRFCKPRHRLVERQHLLPLPAEHAQRDGAFLRLALADDEQVGHLGKAVLAHLLVDFLVDRKSTSL